MENMFIVSLIFILLSLDIVHLQQTLEYHFSHIALQMPESTGRRHIRQNWLIVPHLFQGDKLHVNVCVEARTIVQINNITYSNDGAMKSILLKQDGLEIGRFNTHSESNWGKLWDQPFYSGMVGQTQMLNAGQHELILQFEKSSDCYGFEPWSLQISVFVPTDPKKFWCGSKYSLAKNQASCIPDRMDQTRIDSTHLTRMTTPFTTTIPPTYVSVKQHSYPSRCLDQKNVKISFTTNNLSGTLIEVRQDERQPLLQQFREHEFNNKSRLCNSEIWQLGKADDNNGEFKTIYSGKILTVNLASSQLPEDVFPAKLLPFVTTDIYINFELPPDVNMYHGSAYFTLGLVNLTMPADIGLRYYDHTIKDFSTMHVLSFTPKYQVMGWNIQNLGKTKEANNTIHLHFQSDANIIRFDFLRLEYKKRDERKSNNVLAKRGHWKVRGQRYETSTGMKVSVDDKILAADIEDAVLMYLFSPFGRYETVLRLNSNGIFYMYKSFRVLDDPQKDLIIVDVSGIYFLQNVNDFNIHKSKSIRLLNLDSSTDAIIVHYEDGSILRAQLTTTLTETKMQITGYQAAIDPRKNNSKELQVNNAQGVVFTSTFINDELAAVNSLSNDGKEKQIMENMDELGGFYTFTFRKTSTTNMLYSNNLIKIQFPRR